MNKKKIKKDSSSFIYIGVDSRESNESKVGMTSRDPKARESETTNPYYSIETAYPLNVSKVRLGKIESGIHSVLAKKYRRLKHTSTGKNSEWFSCSSAEARIVIENYLAKLPKSECSTAKGCIKGKSFESERRPQQSSTPDTVLDITAQVIKDCVNREVDKNSSIYQYKALYFRCPECKKVTKQNSSIVCSCSECSFDINKFSHLEVIATLLQELKNATTINSKQAILFDIYNAVFRYQVQQLNSDFKRRKASQIKESEQRYYPKSNVEPLKERGGNNNHRNDFYKNMMVFIFVLLVFVFT